MGTIPGSSHPVPDGAYSPSMSGLSWMQDVTEATARQAAYDQVFPSMQSAKTSLFSNLFGGFFNVMNGIFNGVSSSIPSWFPSAAAEYAESVKNGQDDIRDRVDLLTGLYGYIFTYMSKNINAEWGINNTRTMPFDSQLGPAKNAHIDSDGRVVLDGAGAWLIMVKSHARSTSYSGDGMIQQTVRVLRPDGTVYHTAVDDSSTLAVVNPVSNVKDKGTLLSVFPVVIEEPGCFIQVETWTGAWRWWDGGTRYSMLAAIRQSTDTVNAGSETVPDEVQP